MRHLHLGFLAAFVGVVLQVVFDGFAGFVEGVLVGGAVALGAGEGFVMIVGPLEGVGFGGEDLLLNVGQGADAALMEPVGRDELGDEAGGGFVLRWEGLVQAASTARKSSMDSLGRMMVSMAQQPWLIELMDELKVFF